MEKEKKIKELAEKASEMLNDNFLEKYGDDYDWSDDLSDGQYETLNLIQELLFTLMNK